VPHDALVCLSRGRIRPFCQAIRGKSGASFLSSFPMGMGPLFPGIANMPIETKLSWLIRFDRHSIRQRVSRDRLTGEQISLNIYPSRARNRSTLLRRLREAISSSLSIIMLSSYLTINKGATSLSD
jgi:hypothetical protein